MPLNLLLLLFGCSFSAGRNHVEHLRDSTATKDENIRIQINRMDIFYAKMLTL